MNKVFLATKAAAALALVFSIGVARADTFLYADINNYNQNTSSFGTIDLSTGAFTAINSNEINGLSLAMFNGALYATPVIGSAPEPTKDTLFSVNPANGNLTAIGQYGSATALGLDALGASDTLLYGLGGVVFQHLSLLSVGTGSGTASLIGTEAAQTNECNSGCALSSGSNSLYQAVDNQISTVDAATGMSTFIGNTGSPVTGGSVTEIGALTFQNGTLYAADENNFYIDTIDQTTGAAGAVVRVTGIMNDFFYGLAPDPLTTPVTTPIPEAPTWAIMLACFAGFGFAAHRTGNDGSVA